MQDSSIGEATCVFLPQERKSHFGTCKVFFRALIGARAFLFFFPFLSTPATRLYTCYNVQATDEGPAFVDPATIALYTV